MKGERLVVQTPALISSNVKHRLHLQPGQQLRVWIHETRKLGVLGTAASSEEEQETGPLKSPVFDRRRREKEKIQNVTFNHWVDD